MPLDSLETDGLGLVCDKPDIEMMCPKELNELKLSVSISEVGSVTLNAISVDNTLVLMPQHVHKPLCTAPRKERLLADRNAPNCI